jgi:hypothetical protein
MNGTFISTNDPTIIIIIIIIIITLTEVPVGATSPYTTTDKTNKNKYT